MSSRVRVKICGITEAADAELAIALGADALGFNLYAGSKRHIVLAECAPWIAALPPFVTKVAVLVNAPFAEVCEVARHRAIDLVQLHGDEDAAFCAALAGQGIAFIKALRVQQPADLAVAGTFSTPHLLLDAHAPGSYGGTGAGFDWSLAAALVKERPELHVVLAGGLTPENVGDAIRQVRPFAVDVASGVESAPRRKDPARLRAFVEAAR